MSAPFSTDRLIRGVNVVILSDGREISIEAIATAAQGQQVLDDLDGAILGIEDQLAHDDRRNGPAWRKRAEMALKKKRRQRPALQQRIAELRRAERHPSIGGTAREPKEARRKAFIDAAEELLPHETFVEVWARAAEREPSVFTDAGGGAT
ncbi:hypothetical protein EEDFHM_03525 [Methylorubrum populi]